MITRITGNIIRFLCEEDDIGKNIPYTLPDGYSLHTFYFSRSSTLVTIYTENSLYNSFNSNVLITCPIVNSMSPNSFVLSFPTGTTANTWIELTIYDFGGIPDSHYFDKAFEPILVKSKNENGNEVEYNMIPSTQFER